MGLWTRYALRDWGYALALGLALWPHPAAAQDHSDSRLLAAGVLAFNMAEGADTTLTTALIASGLAREANPLYAPFAHRPGLDGAVKAAVTTGIDLLLYRLHVEHPKLVTWASFAMAGGLTPIIVHNARILNRAKLSY